MQTNRFSLLPRLASTLALGLLAAATTAQTAISGPQSGTLTAGVYHATGSISVASGQTLTLDPGVIIKFVGALQFTVTGTLISNGTIGNPVILTDDDDDTAGGDTNANGASVGAPGAWFNIRFQADSDASTLSFTEVRFAGRSNFSAVDLASADISLDNCTIRDCQARGLQLNSSSFATVSNCSCLNNGGRAFDGLRLDVVPNFTNNTASGNLTNYLRVTSATVASSMTIGTQSMIDGALVLAASVTVQAGATLTVEAGVIIKLDGALQVTIQDTLDCQGTAVNPVIFTSSADDSAGGDTNNDGASSGTPGSWFNLTFQSFSDASTLSYTEVRFAGRSNFSAVNLASADISLDNCTIRDCQATGLQLNSASFPIVSNCSCLNNGGRAFDGLRLDVVPNFTNNTASGNLTNYLRVTSATVASSMTIGAQAMIDGALVLAASLTVQAGATLTVEAGVIIKLDGALQVTIQDTLDCQGTAANPVIFTSSADDSAGGDTNNDGASSGIPGSWFNLTFQSFSDASTLSYTEVRFAGRSNFSAVNLASADISLDNCTIRDCQARGLHLNTSSFPTVSNCAFENNGAGAVDGVRIDALPGFLNNTSTGNGIDTLRVTSGSVSGSLTLGTESMLAGCVLVASSITVLSTGSLTVHRGFVMKLEGALQFVINGTVDLRGSAYEPIVITDSDDDSIVGDSNGNGPSTGVPGAWFNIVVNPAAPAGFMEYVVIRYAGRSNFSALDANNANLSLRAVRIDEAQAVGFRLVNLATNPTNLVAWECGGRGIHLVSGAFHVLHATSTANGTGIRSEAAWSGNIINTNCWGNTTNYDGSTPGNVLSSNGDYSGTNGNIDADPLFVDSANGDLHLLPGSPCLGQAEFAFGLVTLKDFDENSRVLDHELVGSALPDMGAYEFGNWRMTVDNPDVRPGETATLSVEGPAGDSVYAFGLIPAGGASVIEPYGILLAGPLSGIGLVVPVLVPVGNTVPITVPNVPALVGGEVCIQTMTIPPGSNFTVGNFAEVYRMLVRP